MKIVEATDLWGLWA